MNQKLDKKVISTGKLTDDSDEKAYWLSRSPQERLQHIQTLRQMNHGPLATARLQRVLEVAPRK